MSRPLLEADFNGLFGDYLCISHSDSARRVDGAEIPLSIGMEAVAFEPDDDEGRACFLVASGYVVRSPDGVCGPGSRWCLQVDARGVRHVDRLADA